MGPSGDEMGPPWERVERHALRATARARDSGARGESAGRATGGRRRSRPEHLPADQNGIWGMPGAVECGVHVSAVGTGENQLADAKQLIPAQQLSRGG